MGATTDVLIAAIIAMAKILLITAIGVLAAKRPKGEPLFPTSSLATLGKLCNWLFLPALVCSSMGANLTGERLLAFSPLLFADTVVRGIAYVLCKLCSRFLPLERRLFKAVKTAVLFPNAGALPLLFFDSLCDQDIVNAQFEGSSARCTAEATSMIFVYLIGWHLWFYMWGFYRLAKADDLDQHPSAAFHVKDIDAQHAAAAADADAAAADISAHSSSSAATHTSADELAEAGESMTLAASPEPSSSDSSSRSGGSGAGRKTLYISAAQALHIDGTAAAAATEAATAAVSGAHTQQQQQHHHWHDVLSPAHKSSMLARAALTRSTAHSGSSGIKSAAAGAADSSSTRAWRSRLPRVPAWASQFCTVALKPPNVAVFCGVIIAVTPFLREGMFANPQSPLRPIGAALQTVGQPLVALQTLVMAASLSQAQVKLQLSADGSGDGSAASDSTAAAAQLSRSQSLRDLQKRQRNTSCVFVLLPLVAVPAVGFALFIILDRYTPLIGSNSLLRLLLLMECGMPSAQAVIMSLSQLHLPQMSSLLSRLYLYQYATSVVTLTCLAAAAMAYVY